MVPKDLHDIFLADLQRYFYEKVLFRLEEKLSTYPREKNFFSYVCAILKEKTHLRRNKFGACGSTLAQKQKDTYHHGKEKEGQEGNKEAPLALRKIASTKRRFFFWGNYCSA